MRPPTARARPRARARSRPARAARRARARTARRAGRPPSACAAESPVSVVARVEAAWSENGRTFVPATANFRLPLLLSKRPMSLDVKRYPILVVDDEQDNLDAFRFNFKKTFDILTATSGPEALQLLADKEVAVVITDQRMPRMTGVELLREVRTRHPDTVGIILTA